MNASNFTGSVNIVVALNCEARGLIDHFSLKRSGEAGGFVIYANNDGITLLVTGIGKTAMAAACAYLIGQQSERTGLQSAWLNIGIAGHQHIRVGEAVLVSKITDQFSNRTFYPPLLLNTVCKTTELLCVDVPETNYHESVAYDMESSAFFSIINRFVTSELVQLVKIISDNRAEDIAKITEEKIKQLICNNVSVIDSIVQQLKSLSKQYNSIYTLTEECRGLIGRVHLTKNQEYLLIALYRRYYALGGRDLAARLTEGNFDSGKFLIRAIESLLVSL